MSMTNEEISKVALNYAIGQVFSDTGDISNEDLLAGLKAGHLDYDFVTVWELFEDWSESNLYGQVKDMADAFKSAMKMARDGATKPRVLVVVGGGVADPVYDEGADVEVFDWDNYEADPESTGCASARFKDLAERCGVPVEGEAS